MRVAVERKQAACLDRALRQQIVDVLARGIAVDLDGNWHRQDLDFALAGFALEAGCLFALDSDAHSIGELRFSEYAVAHARLAGIPPERVINCWTDERLDEWMKRRRRLK